MKVSEYCVSYTDREVNEATLANAVLREEIMTCKALALCQCSAEPLFSTGLVYTFVSLCARLL